MKLFHRLLLYWLYVGAFLVTTIKSAFLIMGAAYTYGSLMALPGARTSIIDYYVVVACAAFYGLLEFQNLFAKEAVLPFPSCSKGDK